jgi:hypothetical protein
VTLATDSLIAGRAALLDHVGIAASYLDDTVGPVSLSILIAADANDTPLLVADEVTRQFALITIVHTAVTTPKREALVTIASGQWSGTWRITRVQPLTGGGHDCRAEKVTAKAPTIPRAGPLRPMEVPS